MLDELHLMDEPSESLCFSPLAVPVNAMESFSKEIPHITFCLCICIYIQEVVGPAQVSLS